MLMIPAHTPLTQVFAALLSGIRAALANHALRQDHLSGLVALIYARLGRMAFRLDRLAQLWRANKLPKPGKPRPGRPRAPRPAPSVPYPRRSLWLVRIAQPTAQFLQQVEMFLARPETLALVQAAPQAGRLLRPLCHAYGIPLPAYLQLPPRPKRPATPKPPRPPRRARFALPPGDRPLPRNILAAARAWRRHDE